MISFDPFYGVPLTLISLQNFCKQHSSVARGGKWCYSPPIGLKSMRNSMFFAVFSLICARRTKIAPPKRIRGDKKKASVHMKTFYFYFLKSPDFGRKNALNFGEDLFFFEIT